MAPVAERVYTEAWQPLQENKIDFAQAMERAAVPTKKFMLAQIRDNDLTLFADLAKTPPVEQAEELPLRVVVPAFVTSELKTAFQIGFVVFLPFLIIDMVVASVLMSMGMMMMSPGDRRAPLQAPRLRTRRRMDPAHRFARQELRTPLKEKPWFPP